MEDPRLKNKERRKLFTNKQKWARRRTSNKAKRRAARMGATPKANA